MRHLVEIFHKRVFKIPEIGTNVLKIDDNLCKYIEIKSEIDQILRGIVMYNISYLK